MPELIIFAGASGVGKTSLCQFLDFNEMYDIINADAILVEDGGDWRSPVDVLNAGRKTLKKVYENIENNRSFTFETTRLSTYTTQIVKQAKKRNYKVTLNFISVNSLDIAMKRIEYRVKNGGHDIDESVIKERFENRYRGLAKLMKICDASFIYDNSDNLTIVGATHLGEMLYSDKSSDWFKDFYQKEIACDGDSETTEAAASK